MDISIFLAQIIGAYMLITSLSALVKRKTFMQVMKEMARNTHAILLIAALEVILGLILVSTHNIWDGTWHVLITVIAWLVLLEGVFYLFVKQSVVAKLFNWCARNDTLYTIGALVGVAIGLYLSYLGFMM